MKHATHIVNARRYALLLALCVLVAIVVLIALSGNADLFRPLLPDQNGGKNIGEFDNAIDKVKGPINAAFLATVPIGLAAGGGLMAMGSQKGVPIIVSSAGAGAVVLLGNGLLA